MTKERLLGIAGESIVYSVLQRSSVFKNYNPHSHPIFGKIYEDIYGKESDSHNSFRDRLYHTEGPILEALWRLTNMVPRYKQRKNKRREIEMKFIDLLTLQEAVMNKKLSPNEATEIAVKNLARFKRFADDYLPQLKIASRDGGNFTRLRTTDINHEIAKWEKKIQNIIFYGSDEFREFYHSNSQLQENYSPNLDELSPKEQRAAVQDYLEKSGIVIRDKVKEFIKRDRELTGDEKTFIWGEAKLQNMFYDPSSPESVIVIDFPRAKVGPGLYVDLSSILYNTDRLVHGEEDLAKKVFNPFDHYDEVLSANIAKAYFKMMGIPGSEVPERQALLQATRLKDTIRELAAWCKREPFEIKRIMGHGIGRAPYNGETKELFLQVMFGNFARLLEFYGHKQDGWEALISSSNDTDIQKLVRQQIECVTDIFKMTGVTNRTAYDGLKRAYAPGYDHTEESLEEVVRKSDDSLD
ncbi:MAG: hypothetical protein ABIG93_04910 [archaeon]|nr:hypothetical protein [Nanoarchaeota archaeon]